MHVTQISRDVTIGKRISAGWRASCRSTPLTPRVQGTIIEVNVMLRWITRVLVFSLSLISRCPHTLPLVSMQVLSASPDATCCGHFTSWDVDLGQLGIPQCILSRPAAAAAGVQSTNFRVQTSKYGLQKFKSRWLCADTVKVSRNLKCRAGTKRQSRATYYASGYFQLFMSLSSCAFSNNPQHAL